MKTTTFTTEIGPHKVSGPVIEVALADLKRTLFVRLKPPSDRAVQLAEKMTDPKVVLELDPILIAEDMEIIDGRTRTMAHELLDERKIRAVIIRGKSRAELISIASLANEGGPAPSTNEDYELQLKQLIEAKVPSGRLREYLPMLTPKMIRDMSENIKARAKAAKESAARQAVASGEYSISAAAEKFDVPESRLKELISGSRKKRRDFNLSDAASQLENFSRSHSSRIQHFWNDIRKKLEYREIKPEDVAALLEREAKALAKFCKNFDGWATRFKASGVEVKTMLERPRRRGANKGKQPKS